MVKILVIALFVLLDFICIRLGVYLAFLMDFNITGIALMGIVFGFVMMIPCTEFVVWGFERSGLVTFEDDVLEDKE